MPFPYTPLSLRWYTFITNQGFKEMESKWDCCWVVWYNIALVVVGILLIILLFLLDVIIIISCIIPYDCLYGCIYSCIRCCTCGKFESLRRFFIKFQFEINKDEQDGEEAKPAPSAPAQTGNVDQYV